MTEESQPSKSNVDNDSDSEFDSEEELTQRSWTCNEPEDPKWAAFLQEESEEETPRMHITERIKLKEESEEKLLKEAYERGLRALKTRKIEKKPKPKPEPVPEPAPEPAPELPKLTKEEIEAREKELEEIAKEEQRLLKMQKRQERLEHDERIRKMREQQPLEYFWKPNPLFFLHLLQLGYSRIAVEKALYYTDNESVDLAEKYIEEHPDLSPLTKEEVMADAESFLNQIRPKRTSSSGSYEVSSSSENEMEAEEETRPMEEEAPKLIFLRERKDLPKGNAEEDKSSHDRKVEVKPAPILPHFEEKVELFFMLNSHTELNAAALSLKLSKVTMDIMEELKKEKWKQLYEDWIKDGKCMNVYHTDGPNHVYQMRKKVKDYGYLHSLAEISNPRSPNVPLPVVLGILTHKKFVRRVSPKLSQIN